MIICGIKLTHDGAVSLIENNRLVFCVELEKVNNNPRFQQILDTNTVAEILEEHGYKLEDIDQFVIDGWGGDDQDALAIQPRLTIDETYNWLSVDFDGEEGKVKVGQYEEGKLSDSVLKRWQFDGLKIKGKEYPYSSYYHVAGHIMSAYCTSEFAAKKEDSFVLVWDGGMYPRLYYINKQMEIENLGPIFLLIGNIYTIFSQHFGPFKVNGTFAKDSLSVAGKVMAYISKGKNHEELYPVFDDIYKQCYSYPMGFANVFANEFKNRIKDMDISDEDILCTFHYYLEKMLIEKLKKKIGRSGHISKNLCISGGCALNIKWNSSIRNSRIVEHVYVSPFPNDSGSAIGMACCEMYKKENNTALEWNVYSGPDVKESDAPTGWVKKECSKKMLAKLLYETNEPVVVIDGKAELGPRALGNRSILASPVKKEMKDILNYVKDREAYRPVSPICLESEAEQIFEPGTRDPYMLFDHMVKEEWIDKIPAVIHLDGSARLQTTSTQYNETITEIITEFYHISGIPLLCNTSANYKGRGFFPDVKSVMEWNQVNYVWSQGTLYEKIEKMDLQKKSIEKRG